MTASSSRVFRALVQSTRFVTYICARTNSKLRVGDGSCQFRSKSEQVIPEQAAQNSTGTDTSEYLSVNNLPVSSVASRLETFAAQTSRLDSSCGSRTRVASGIRGPA
jgi:hypothetical protein